MGPYLRFNKVDFLKIYIPLLFAFFILKCSFSQNLNLNSFAKSINENELKSLIYVYASDFFKVEKQESLDKKEL